MSHESSQGPRKPNLQTYIVTPRLHSTNTDAPSLLPSMSSGSPNWLMRSTPAERLRKGRSREACGKGVQ